LWRAPALAPELAAAVIVVGQLVVGGLEREEMVIDLVSCLGRS
jgi:hypothetical protein